MNTKITLLLAFFLIIASLSFATPTQPKTNPPTKNQNKGGGGGGNPNNGGGNGFFGSGGGYDIPGWGGVVGGGWGGGAGGPSGGSSGSGVIRPVVVCKDKGPCYKKKLRCPAKCFTSWSRSGKGYGGGGGGGGCTMDCKKKCIAYC